MSQPSQAANSPAPDDGEIRRHAKTYLTHILNKSMMAMYLHQKITVADIVVEALNNQVVEQIFSRRKTLINSILYLIDRGFDKLSKPKKLRRVSQKVKSGIRHLDNYGYGTQSEPSAMERRFRHDRKVISHHLVQTLNKQFKIELAKLTYLLEQVYKYELAIAHNPLAPQNLIRHFNLAMHSLNLDPKQQLALITILMTNLDAEYLELLKQTERSMRDLPLQPLKDFEVDYQYQAEYAFESSQMLRAVLWEDLLQRGDLGQTENISKQYLQLIEKMVQNAAQNQFPFKRLIDIQLNPATPLDEETMDEASLFKRLAQLTEFETLTLPAAGYLDQANNPPTIASLITAAYPDNNPQLRPATCDQLNFLSMIFVQFERDSNIHPQIKQLIMQLRLPFIKVALKDPYYLLDPQNPLQILFDKLCSASAKWMPSQNQNRDSLYNNVALTVQMTLQHFDDDYQPIDDVIDGFELFSKAEMRRVKLIESNFLQKKLSSDLTDMAQAKTHQHIKQTFGTLESKPELAAFIEQVWQPVLNHHYIHETQTDDETEIRIDDKTLFELEQAMLAQLSGKPRMNIDRLIIEIRRQFDQAFNDTDKVNRLTCQLKKLVSDHQRNTTDFLNKPTQGIQLVEIEEEIDNAEFSRLFKTDQDSFDKAVSSLAPNDWVELEENGRVSKRRIAALLDFNDALLLVDRNGTSASNVNKSEFADKLRNGNMTMKKLQTDLFFDRILKTICEQLK